MTTKRRKVTTFEWSAECARCGHRWKTLGNEAPTRCPGCKARGFDRPARPYTRKAAKK